MARQSDYGNSHAVSVCAHCRNMAILRQRGAIVDPVEDQEPTGDHPRLHLHWPARRGQIEEVRRLLALGADLNETLIGTPPLHWATMGQHEHGHGTQLEIVELLLQHKADVTSTFECSVAGRTGTALQLAQGRPPWSAISLAMVATLQHAEAVSTAGANAAIAGQAAVSADVAVEHAAEACRSMKNCEPLDLVGARLQQVGALPIDLNRRIMSHVHDTAGLEADARQLTADAAYLGFPFLVHDPVGHDLHESQQELRTMLADTVLNFGTGEEIAKLEVILQFWPQPND